MKLRIAYLFLFLAARNRRGKKSQYRLSIFMKRTSPSTHTKLCAQTIAAPNKIRASSSYLKCFYSILPLWIQWTIFMRDREVKRKLFSKIKNSKGQTIKWFSIFWDAAGELSCCWPKRIHVDLPFIEFIQLERGAKTILFGWKKRKINRFYIFLLFVCTLASCGKLHFFSLNQLTAFSLWTI